MDPEDYDEDNDHSPDYRRPAEFEGFELAQVLCSLHLLDGDPFLRMQAFNISVVDLFIMDLEYETLSKLYDEESSPNLMFLTAQSQMWIFSAYELLRTWRTRAKEVVKWAQNGGLNLKIEALEKDLGYIHPARQIRAEQLRQIRDNPDLVQVIKDDLRVIHIPFTRLEFLRVALAKHEVSGRDKGIAHMPGYGRINRWCGSLDYELTNDPLILGNISRRDVADELRSIADRGTLPTDEQIAAFDAFMKASAPPVFVAAI